LALAGTNAPAHVELLQLSGDRAAIREATVHAALQRLLGFVSRVR
jgi:nicotinamide mononucleotide (NMN) deamidase PncC